MQNLLPKGLGPLIVLVALAGCLGPQAVADEPTSEAKLRPAAPADAEPAAKPVDTKPAARPEKLRFQFRYQPWKDVLDWFAQQADLSLVMDAPPQGTFNYSDTREYTPAEAIDLLNSVLQTKGYTLVRRGRMLMLVNLEDGVPANLVSTVPIESLDKLGESELVSVLYNLDQLKPEEAEAEIRKLLGPQGSVVALAKSRQLLVTDTAGRLRSVRSVLRRIEGPEGSAGSVQTAELKFARNDDVLPILRQLLEIPEDKTSAADGSIRIATESGSSRLLISGRAEKVARALEIIKGLDVPAPGSEGVGRVNGTPQLEVYPITGADPQAVLAIVQALLAGQTDARLAVDPKTGSLIAMARPSQHATIRATIAQLQKEGQRVEVIRLVRLDPQTAVLSINKLFASGDPKAPTTGPHVDADPASRQLMIRGTAAQIAQIRDMLSQMGENLSPAGGGSPGGRVRTIPLSGPAARAALGRVQEIWPGMRPNKIRVVSPAGSSKQPGEPSGIAPEKQPAREKSPAPSPEAPAVPRPQPTAGPSATLPYGAQIILAAQQLPTKAPADEKPAAPIIVVPGPGGLTISSEDTEALDEFERLLQMATQADSIGGDISVFYLKNAKAASVAETLDRIFAGGASDAGGSSGKEDEPSGALARAALSRRPLMTGPVKITPETRLNALLIQANRADLDSIEQVLKILDMKESPEEVSVAPKPRLIPIVHTRAQEVADVVKQVYADRMSQQAGVGQQPQLPFFMRMGGFGGPGGPGGPEGFGGRRNGGGAADTSSTRRDDPGRISIGVDTRTNTLIVAATDAVFEEVKQLVEQLDVAAGDQGQTVQVVTLHRTSASAVERALMAIAGDSVQMKRSAETPAASQAAPQQPPWQSRSRGSRSGGYGSPMMQGGGSMPGSSASPWQDSQGYQGGGGRRWRSYQSGQGGSPQPGGRQ